MQRHRKPAEPMFIEYYKCSNCGTRATITRKTIFRREEGHWKTMRCEGCKMITTFTKTFEKVSK